MVSPRVRSLRGSPLRARTARLAHPLAPSKRRSSSRLRCRPGSASSENVDLAHFTRESHKMCVLRELHPEKAARLGIECANKLQMHAMGDALSSASSRNTSVSRQNEIVQADCAGIRRSTSTESANLADLRRNRDSSGTRFVGATKRCERKAKGLLSAQVIPQEVKRISCVCHSLIKTHEPSPNVYNPASLLRTPPDSSPQLHESAKRVLGSLAPLSSASHTSRSTVGSLK